MRRLIFQTCIIRCREHTEFDNQCNFDSQSHLGLHFSHLMIVIWLEISSEPENGSTVWNSDPLCDIHNSKCTGRIGMNPYLPDNQGIEILSHFSHSLTGTGNIGRFKFTKLGSCKMTEKDLKYLVKS